MIDWVGNFQFIISYNLNVPIPNTTQGCALRKI